MPSKLFDPRPRDDVNPSPEEVRRAMVPRAFNPEEQIGPDYPLPESDAPTRAKLPPLFWPADKDAPDYAHLEPLGREPVVGDKKFRLTADDMERLLKANAFAPKGPDGRFVIAFRGANLIDDEDGDNDGAVDGVDHLKLEETRPDHIHFRCVIGYYHPGTRMFTGFRASTVPNVHYMTNYYKHENGLGGTSTGANMLPTGCYVFRVGAHSNGTLYPALRLTDSQDFSADGAATVLRSKNDLTFKTDDLWDNTVTQDHVHCAYSMDDFSSAGCQTVQGTPGGDGPWGHFQAVLKRFKNNTRIDYVLLTGRDASIAAYLGTTGRATDSDYAARLLGRLRPGSTSEAVGRLQAKLGMEPSGYFGPSTKEALVNYQRNNGLAADGIYSPALDDKLGWGILKPAVAPPAAQPTPQPTPQVAPKPVAQPSPQPAPQPVTQAQPQVAPAAAAAPPAPIATTPPPAPIVAAPAPASAPPAPAAFAAQVATAAPLAATLAPIAASAATSAIPASAAAPAGSETRVTPTRTPARDQFTSVNTTAGATAGAIPPPARTVSPGLGAVAQRTSPSPATPLPSAPVARAQPAPAAPPPMRPQAAAAVTAAPMRPAAQPTPAAARPAVSTPVNQSTGMPTRHLVITPETLQAFAPQALPQYRDALVNGNDWLTRYAINLTPLRLCHFLGQIGNECGRLTVLEENLDYHSATRIREVWPSRFLTQAAAEPYLAHPQQLAEKVYGDRFDNGPGDGWRYRGRGLVQLTGRSNYREMGQKLGIPLEQNPELALDPRYALAIACETWASRQLAGERDMNKLADANKLDALTYRINGGYANIDDRRAAFEHAWEVWSSGDPPMRTLDPDLHDRGDRGGRVDELNARLKDFGLFDGITEHPPQHVYSTSTYKAVRILQAESGLAETGVTDPETWSALEHAVERGLASRGRGSAGNQDKTANPKRNVVARRLGEVRFWAITLSILALAYVVSHIFLLTHPTGNVVLWLPMLFAGVVFVAGMALWLAARPQPHWQVATPRGTVRTMVRRAPSSFISGEEEPVRQGINM